MHDLKMSNSLLPISNDFAAVFLPGLYSDRCPNDQVFFLSNIHIILWKQNNFLVSLEIEAGDAAKTSVAGN